MPLRFGKPTDDELRHLAEVLEGESLTYAEAEGTRASPLPAGYKHDHRSVILGSDDESFDVGKEGLVGWQAHRSLGARLFPSTPPLRVGQVVVAAISLGPVTAVAPCRVIYVTDERDRFGFAYGTLPGHPECGEESFHILRTPTKVTFEIVAFSKPADPLVRLVGPISRFVQVQSTVKYLVGLRRYVDDHRQRPVPDD